MRNSPAVGLESADKLLEVSPAPVLEALGYQLLLLLLLVLREGLGCSVGLSNQNLCLESHGTRTIVDDLLCLLPLLLERLRSILGTCGLSNGSRNFV